MSSWARVGVKVVCVDDTVVIHCGKPEMMLRRGDIYTITGTYVETGISHVNGVICDIATVSLLEAPRMGRMRGYAVSRFRPLISQADDVAMFTALVETMKPTERLDRLAELLDTTPS